MFLLRCAFWLGIVYAAIAFGAPRFDVARLNGARAVACQGGRAGEASATVAVCGAATIAPALGAVAEVAQVCAGREGSCFSQAAALTSLVETALAAAPSYIAEPVPHRSAGPRLRESDIPLPVPDPRRRHGFEGFKE